ncbi:beta-galactosidase trimerization domain-containing protein [Marinivivus vitaminiproducens]|uniref:beta-galactosidase trimerization domain-containing protein n=1 Tax=Marinivivus vitaminiproducens TaxID=3035935 RepID=UPI00279CAD48|nr:beta-galactosidase trimerization domain-containing protein [Geminicoccaceae bacterium SCSIO 64248]
MLDAHERPTAVRRSRDWYASATRWTQLTLAENDPVAFDPAVWLDIFKRTRSNATCLSAGGYIAYYPSKVPLHYVSTYIGDSDPFGTLVDGARRLGMHVMARVDPHAIHQDAADAHPEWVAVDKDGNKRRHWSYPGIWVTCAYSDYNFKFMPQVVEEITATYDIDAIFANRWQGHGVCYCDACRANFKAASGFDLPMTTSVDDPAWLAWGAWRRTVLSRLVAEWDAVMKAIKPHTSFIPNMGSISLMEFDLDVIEKYCPFLCVDDQGRTGVEPVWMAGRNGKRIRGTFRDRPTILITSIGPEERHRWKDAVTTAPEMQAWIDNGTAQGLLPWFTKFNGVVSDQRWIGPVAESFARYADLEPILSATAPSAEIAILDPTTTLRHHDGESRKTAEAHDLGVYQALIEARLPFEMVSDQAMTPRDLDRFKVVILANSTCLSDAQARMLTDYVARGGAMVVGYETGTRTEDNAPRSAPVLADLLGVRVTSPARGPVKNSYVAIAGDHPLTHGFEDATRIIGGTHLIAVEPTEDVETPFLYIPDFPDLPMEEVYPREKPEGAAVIARRHPNGGRTVFIPWNVGQVFWDVLAADHARLITNAVHWALGKEPDVRVAGRAVLDVAVRSNDEGLVVLLHNLTNPMMMKGPIRETFPVGEQEVSVAVPAGKRLRAARLLVAGVDAAVREGEGRVAVAVPGVETLEAVHLTWA